MDVCIGFEGPVTFFLLTILTIAAQMQDDDPVTNDDDLVAPGDSYSAPGTYYFGGLFDIHNSRGGLCHQINPRGLQRMYAMVYAINMINERPDILPNVTIGFDIHDTCADPNIAVAASLDFITSSSSATNCNGDDDVFQDFVGVVGPPMSSSAVSVASLFGLFKIPEISYSATSTILSESRFEYFTRTVPTDANQATALADIVAYFGWSVVAAISTDDLAYGIDGRDLFVEEAAKRNICVGYMQQISTESSVEYLESIVEDLRKFPNIKVIVAFATEDPILKLFSVFASHNASGYTWLGTDGVTASVHIKNSSLTPVTRGMMGLRLHTKRVDGFNAFLKSRSPLMTQFQDPFIIEYWEETFACYLTERGKSGSGFTQRCMGNESLPEDDLLYDSLLVSAIVDAVDVISIALHDLLRCNFTEGCLKDFQRDGVPKDLMLERMKDVNFTGYSEYRIDFTENGDLSSEAWYDILNLQPTSNCSEDFNIEIVGSWRRSLGGLSHIIDVFWSEQDTCDWRVSSPYAASPPDSFCSRSCHPGERRTSSGLSHCCWDCVRCPDDHYSDTYDATNCNNCSGEQVSNSNRTECVDLRKVYLNPKSYLGLTILSGATIGALLTIAMFIVFVVKRRTVIVHYACAETHAFTILFCVLFCFGFSGLSVIQTTELVCILTSGLQMLPVTLLQGFLILTAYIICKKKANVLARKQFFIILLVLILHVGVAVSWYFISKPVVTHTADKKAEILYVDCRSDSSFDTKTIILLCNIALDCFGMATAYGIRALSENFYEGKFVFFTFVIHIMLWCATLATYLAITPGMHYQPVIVSWGMQITGLSVLGSMYVPKLYLMRTKPEANDRVQRSSIPKSRTNHDHDTAFKVINSDPVAKRLVLDNYRKVIEAAKGEKHQAVRVATMCNDKMEELRLRYRSVISEKKTTLHRMRQRRLMAVVSSPLVEPVYC